MSYSQFMELASILGFFKGQRNLYKELLYKDVEVLLIQIGHGTIWYIQYIPTLQESTVS